ncbi:MAG: hypothetical protein ACOCQG_06110 [Candidatus Nanoarchaeia archaeon]
MDANFTCHNTYIEYCLNIARESLNGYNSIPEIKENQPLINAYKNIDFLDEPKNVSLLDGEELTEKEINEAVHTIMKGKFFAEHTCAGEATRLGLGTKYLINIARDLSVDKISRLVGEEKERYVSNETVIEQAGVKPSQLLSLSLGTRHMLQYSFDIFNLAKRYGYNSNEVLKRQKMLVVLNEDTAEKIINEFVANNFFGFSRENVMFMVQRPYHGINMENGKFYYDQTTPKRLHNHGQMVMQQTIDEQIFFVDENNKRKYMKSDEFGEILKEMEDKISYNIEDLEYLTGSIDFDGLAFALKKSAEGYDMVMEIVANNPENPQKGGMAAFDKNLGRNVMIEGFQLKGIKNHEITYLNKNFNHYPSPYKCWSMLKKHGLQMPVDIKGGYIYFQPVQGDINFLVKTKFFRRKELKPIKAWKSPATTPLAIKYMRAQDRQKGFKEYAKSLLSESAWQ